MILVDEKECMALLKKHRFRDLKEMFSVDGMTCENCKNNVVDSNNNQFCRFFCTAENFGCYCKLWEVK